MSSPNIPVLCLRCGFEFDVIGYPEPGERLHCGKCGGYGEIVIRLKPVECDHCKAKEGKP